MPVHPALRARALTVPVELHDGIGPAIATRGKLDIAPADVDVVDAQEATLRVPTPALAADREIVEVTAAGQRYAVLRRDRRAPAAGTRAGFDSTTFQLRTVP